MSNFNESAYPLAAEVAESAVLKNTRLFDSEWDGINFP
jgi:hypothetical protein